jgi:multiple sugar transport system ATP-binding protein
LTATVTLRGVDKVYGDGTHAVSGLDLQIEPGELMVIVGPSGCGKTTTLRMTAGLEEVTAGEILIGERVVNALDPGERDVAMVFQNYALYPHMSVFDNLAFPLRARGLPRAEIRSRVQRTARLLELDDQLTRKPRALSGGQRQRVAMGRAIVREPQVFLMDEPLSNLDARLRADMRAEIAGLQRNLGATMMYVTHDQLEAMTMGTRIAVLHDGVMRQCGPPQTLYDAPDDLFVATFLGSPPMNVLPGRIERVGETLECAIGRQRLEIRTNAAAPALAAYAGHELVVGLRAEHLSAADGRNASGSLRGRVESVELLGSEQLVKVALAAVEAAAVTARLDAHAPVGLGDPIDVAVNIERLHFFDPVTHHVIR